MKNAFMIGMGLGFVLGNLVLKRCPSLQNAVNNAENTIKSKVNECKAKMESNDPQSDV